MPVVNAGPLDTEYLYYPLDMESFTLNGLMLPAHTKQTITITIIEISTNIAFIYQFQFSS